MRLTVRRLALKYAIRDFHPLVLFYALSVLLLGFVGIPMLTRFLLLYQTEGVAPTTTLLLLSFALTNGFFSLFFAMWMDMEDNRDLWLRIRRPRAKKVRRDSKDVRAAQPTTTLSC
jgi:hypothetical protein